MYFNQINFSFGNAWLSLKKLNFCYYFFSNLARIIEFKICKKRKIVLNLVTLQLIKSLVICVFSTPFNVYQNTSLIQIIFLMFFYRLCSELQSNLKINKSKENLETTQFQIQLNQLHFANTIKGVYQSYISIILQCFNRMLLCKSLLQSVQLHYSNDVILIMMLGIVPKLTYYQKQFNERLKQTKIAVFMKRCQSQWTLWIIIIFLMMNCFQFLQYQLFLGLLFVEYVLVVHFVWVGYFSYLAFCSQNNFKKLKFTLYFISLIYYPLAFFCIQKHVFNRNQNSVQIQILISLNAGIFLANAQFNGQINQLIEQKKVQAIQKVQISQILQVTKKGQVTKEFIFNLFPVIYSIRFSSIIIQFYYGNEIDQSTQSYYLYEKLIIVYIITGFYLIYELFQIKRQTKKVFLIK